MRVYHVTVGQNVFSSKASRASVAVHRVLDRFTDSQLDGATITIRRGPNVEYAYQYYADVPCEPAGSTKREAVGERMASQNEAIMGIDGFRKAHPEYRFVQYQRVEL